MDSTNLMLGKHEAKLEDIVNSLNKVTDSLDKNSEELHKVAIIVSKQEELLKQLSKLESSYRDSHSKASTRLTYVENDVKSLTNQVNYLNKWKWLLLSTTMVVIVQNVLKTIGIG